MTENQKAWLRAMYDEEIRQAAGTAENERTWADGAADHDAKFRHLVNAEEHEGYVWILQVLRRKVDSPEMQEEVGL